MIFFFYTIPIWVIVAVFLFIVGGLGAIGGGIASWIIAHIVAVSVIFWALVALVAMLLAEKGNRMECFSVIMLLIPPYIVAINLIAELVEKTDDVLLMGVYTILIPFGIVIYAVPSILAGVINHCIPWKFLTVTLNLLVALGYTIIIFKRLGCVIP